MIAAVSGGSDSLALLHLLKSWRDRSAPSLDIVAVTVDHRLRPESAGEARQVAATCARWGIAHGTMVWSGTKPEAGIAEAARLARYGLLAQAALAAGTDIVLTGHTMDDQAETVAMRRARDTGGGDRRGLAGMAGATLCNDRVWIARPLLGHRRQELRSVLGGLDERWIDDPSNESAASERVRLRRALAAGTGEVEKLAAQADDAAGARAAANLAAARILSRGAPAAPGLVSLPADLLLAGGDAALLALRVLAAATGGAAHLPDEAAARRLLERLANGDAGATLAGAVVASARGALWFHREARGLPEPGRIAGDAVWDGRYRAPAALDVATTGIERARAAADGFDGLPRRLVTAALAAEPFVLEAPPPPVTPPSLTPPHKGEGDASVAPLHGGREPGISEFPSPLWGGVRGGGLTGGTALARQSLVRVVAPWVTFLPGFDIPLRNAAARLVGAAPVPASPCGAAPFPRHNAP